jgi:PilZ domain
MNELFSRVQGPKRAVLIGRRTVDIGDVSRMGCRFNAAEPLAVGSVGMLSVTISGQIHVEMFRVSRADRLSKDERLYEIGVEFLALPAERASLQDVIVQLESLDSIS